MKMLALFSAIVFIHCYAGIENHYRKLENKLGSSGMENIDYIYLINLDQRPEKWISCLNQLIPYGIFPERFPGIYGWTLSPAVLNEISVQFQHGMWTGKEAVMHFPLDGDGSPQWVFLSGAFNGKGCFSGTTVIGTIGCSLAHLSVLKDAYDSDYKTIWVMEDDIAIYEDPHQLSDLILELESLVGPNGWDVLYTDYNFLYIDPNQDLSSQIPERYWRPDMPYLDVRFVGQHQDVGENFMKIGSRMRNHSMIYSRSGIEKIVNFYRTHNNFLPYDNEIALIPGIRLYTLKRPIVSFNEVTSDTRDRYFK
jgi:GR25 family glycosyltransferase involved in LPS biosynthesis